MLMSAALAMVSSTTMAASGNLALLALLSTASASYVRLGRDIGGASSGAFSGASSSSFSSAGTKVAPGPGGHGNLNAFAGTSNYGSSPGSFGGGGGGGGGGALYRGGGGADGGGGGQMIGQPPFGFPGFNPFVPQYGQAYPYTPFPTFGAPFDFMQFLNEYLQSVRNFQAQAEAQAQQAAASGFPSDTNEVGGSASATYSPQGGYGSANVFPAPEGGLDTRFGGDEGTGTPQNSVGGGPVSSVSGSFPAPGGNRYGVYTSSSSGSTDVNGKKTSFKQSSVSIDDNGKVTTYTAHDP